jgi:integrase/recombinase XerD
MPDIRTILAGQLTASSIAMYKRDVHAYATFADERGLPQFDHQTLITWRDHLATNTTMSPHTINRMMSAVRRTVKEAAARQIVETSIDYAFSNVAGVSVRALKERLKMHARTRITAEDMRRMCEAPDASTLLGKRDRALLATMASSGLRASEVASLTYGQIEQQGKGYILKVQGKTDIGYRDAHLSAEAKELIDTWIAARAFTSPHVFTSFSTRGAIPSPDPLSKTAVWLIVQKYARVCNLTHIKAHDFRRFLGTQLAKDDLRKAQKALGHKNIDTTARHYVLDELEPGATDHLY